LYHTSQQLEGVLSGAKKSRFFPTKNLDFFHRKKI